MSCRTYFIVVIEEGSVRAVGLKHRVNPQTVGPDELVALIADGPVALTEANLGFGPWCCAGVLLDVPGRRFRYFPCYSDPTPLATVDTSIRTAPRWVGWDAGLAFGGREDFAELVPAAARIVKPYEVLDRASDEAPVRRVEEDLRVNWDPDTFTLTIGDDYRHEHVDLITIVTPQLRVYDFEFGFWGYHDVHPVLVWLRGGPEPVTELLGGIPFPLPASDRVTSGAIIDQDRRIIWYWLTALVPSRLRRAVEVAWPRWSVQPIAGWADHLALTGRLDRELGPGQPAGDDRAFQHLAVRVDDSWRL